MTYIIKNIYSHLSNQSLFSRSLGAIILTLTLLIGECAWGQNVVATWDWKKNDKVDNFTSVETNTCSIASDQSGISLYVDASKGKVWDNGDNIGVNPGTVISVPVTSTNDVVVVRNYPGYTGYKVGNKQTPVGDYVIHYVTRAEANAHKVDITVTASGSIYLHTIKVAQNTVVNTSYIAEWNWNQASDVISSSLTKTVQNGSSEVEELDFEESNVAGVTLTVDATASGAKVQYGNNGTGYIQFNTGAVIQVPVKCAGDKITVNAYPGNAGYKIGDGSPETADVVEYTVTTADARNGYVKITATNDKYLCGITLRHYEFKDFALNMYNGTPFFTNTPTGNPYYVVVNESDVASYVTSEPTFYNAKMTFGGYNGDQHGYANMVATIPVVPGRYDITIGNCQHTGPYLVKNGETLLETINANAGCYAGTAATATTKRITIDSPMTLTIINNGQNATYTPYFAISKLPDSSHSLDVSVSPDGGGTVTGTGIHDAGETVTLTATPNRGYSFVKWTDASDNTLSTSASYSFTMPDEDITYKAVFEVLRFELDFTKTGENRLISGSLPAGTTIEGTLYETGTHGSTGVKVTFPVTTPSIITVSGCDYDESSDVATLKVSGSDVNIAAINTKKVGCNGKAMFCYSGGAATLELTGGTYCSYVAVEAITDDMEFEDHFSVYDAKVSNVHQLRKALATADGTTRYKIYLENNTYDLGTRFGTFVKDNVTLVGESRDGVIIKNTPANEGIWTSATLLTGSNVVMQNLTLKCTVTKVDGNERGTALYDNGSGNVYKNVCLLGRQDTYYSHDATNSYFENCEIHGTVDFICGSGNVWFEKCNILIESSDNAYITAARKNGTSEYNGYIFNECTIDNATGADMAGKYYLGRAWGADAKVAYYKTTKKIAPHDPKWTVMDGGVHVVSDDLDNSPSNPVSSPVTYMPAPARLTFENGVLTWTAVTGAQAYAIFKGNRIIAVVDADVLSYTAEAQSYAKGSARRQAQALENRYSVAAIDADGIVGDQIAYTEIAFSGTTFYYDFRKTDFDFDDHELLSKIGESGQSTDAQHGWEFTAGTGFSVQVAGNARIYVSRCGNGGSGKFTVTSGNGMAVTPSRFDAKAPYDGVTTVLDYEGPATTLSFTADAQCYVHSVKVVNEGAVAIKVADSKDHVTIRSNVSGASIYYTVDGSTPTTENSKDVFTEASHDVYVKDCWVKAICVKDGVILGSDEKFCRSTFAGFSWDFSNGGTLLGNKGEYVAFDTGVVIDDRGEVHLVPVGEVSSSIDIRTAYHDGQHGYLGMYATVPVEGPVIISVGNCQYGNGKITISTSDGDKWTMNPSGTEKCYHQDRTSQFTTFEYTGGPTVLTIASEVGYGINVYIPYLSVRDASSARVKFVNIYEKTLLGSVPDEVEVNEAHQAYIPENTTLYRKGWAVTGWEDPETGTQYELGRNYTFNQNTTLNPVITLSNKAITDTNTPLTVTWKFDQEDGAPRYTLHNAPSDPTSMTYVKCVEVEGAKVDVPLVLDATNNKIDNNDDRVNALPGKGSQFNDGSAVRIPAVYGMTITLNASDKVDIERYGYTTTNFTEGEAPHATIKLREGETELSNVGTVSPDGKTITFTYNGDATTIDVLMKKAGSGESWGFYESLSVTYPVLPNVVIENVISNADKTTFPNEVPEKAGQASVTLKSEAEGVSHANTGKRFRVGDVVTLATTTDYGYAFTGFRKKGETDNYIGTTATTEYTVPAEGGIITVEAVYTRKDLVKVTAVAAEGQKDLGTIALSPKYSNFYNTLDNGVEAYFEPKTEVTATAEATKDYIIYQWVDQWVGGSMTTPNKNFYTFTLSSDANDAHNIVAHFKLGEIGNVIFQIDKNHDNTSTGVHSVADPNTFNSAVSVAPASQTGVRSFYIPNYYTFFKNQYTLTHWVDQNGRKYSLGTYGSFATANETLTLTPVFQHNIADKENRTRGDALYWDFRTMNLAQEINEETKNKNFFWTSKVSVEVIEEGQRRDHTRDVALWVHTNGEGYVRNDDLPEWVSFGPGTVFDIPSCAGATLKMYTYSPITSTTFDGHIPVLDEEATRELHVNGEKGYVYKYVTSNPNPRVSIAIGDDYSYYKWIRCYSLPASMYDLHVNVDDNAHGEVLEIKGSGTTETLELADGGISYQKGDRSIITFKRKFGYRLKEIVDINRFTATGDPFPIVRISRDENTGAITGVRTVKKDSDDDEAAVLQSDGSWKSGVFTFKVIAPTAEGERESYELQFEITNHRDLEIRFEEKPTYYITYSAGPYASGVAPAAAWVEKGDKFTVPYNRTLYYEYNTLKSWLGSDGITYNLGQTYDAPSADLRLTPVFEENSFSVFDITADATAKWDFTRKEGAPTMEYERSSGILVAQLSNGSDFIDMKIDLDASEQYKNGEVWVYNGSVVAGKINNAAYNDRCQINEHSVITYPSNRNCVIELEALEEISSKVKIEGGGTLSEDGKTLSNTHTFGSTNHSIVFGDDGSDGNTYQTWCTALTITYKPVATNKPRLTAVTCDGIALTSDELTTLTTSANKEVNVSFTVSPDDSFPEVVATVETGVVSVTQANLTNGGKAVIKLMSYGGVAVEDYFINFVAASSVPHLYYGEDETPYIFVNTKRYNQNEIPWDQPVSGTISIRFDRTMAAVGSSANIKLTDNEEEEALTANQSSTLIFRYWDLDVDKEYTLTIPKNTLHDVYGGTYGEDISVTFRTVSVAMQVEHRKFNWIVGVDGTLSEGINAANSATGLDRYYIFVPDGEYELEGNFNITPATEGDATTLYDDKGNKRTDLVGVSINNGKTRLNRANVSLIGQSETGTQIYNKPIIEGLDYTATLYLTNQATDFYAQELTLENRFDYRKAMSVSQNNAARAVALQGHGSGMIMKNVSVLSYQDTYYSSNGDNPDFCGYFEECSLAGVVDWICGGGNIWFEKCNIIHRDRAGNNILAPHTNVDQKWGIVLSGCDIKAEKELADLQYMKSGDWTLARPWGSAATGQSPACTFLHTDMHIPPRDAGWGIMYGGMVLRFHEYKTKNASGNLVSLGARSLVACAPAVGSDDCILSDAEANKYVLKDVLEFDPRVYTAQREAVTNLSIEDGVLSWDASADGLDLCYFIFKKDADGKWKYYANVAETRLDFNTYGVDVREGTYMIRAANQRGGLGAVSVEIQYKEAERFDLTIAEVVQDSGMGWSTICLPNNAKVPTNIAGLKVYAAVSIDDNIITLKRVDYITADIGYVVYGPVGTYTFRGSSHTAKDTPDYNYNHDSYLSGNSGDVRVTASTTNCYTLAYKANVSGIGFYKYTGTWLNPHKAYLDVDVFKLYNGSNSDEADLLSKSFSKGIRFVFAPEEETTDLPLLDLNATVTYDTDAIYDLSGRRVITPVPGRIYIINGTKTLWE